MRILILRDFNMFTENTASANRYRTIAEGLAKLDVEILLVITSGYNSVEERGIYGIKGKINDRIRYQYISEQNNYDYWPTRINKYLLSRFYVIPARIKLRKIITEFIPGIVLLHPGLEVFKIVTGIMSSFESRFKLAMEINEYNDLGDIHLSNRFQKLNKRAYNFYLKNKIFPQLDICLVITNTLLKHYSSFPGLKSNISFLKVSMTVDLNRFGTEQLGCSFKKPYIAYCGTSSFYKDGVDILIKSFTAISDQYPELSLNIAAFWHKDGPKMLELIRATGLENRITYLGTLSRDDMPSFLINASLLALPRPDSLQAQGGFPTKLGEYLATGNPVCVTKVGEIPEYLKDNDSAFMAEPGDIDSFTTAMKNALSDQPNAKRVGNNGKKVAKKHFNMDAQSKRIYKIFTEVLVNHKRSQFS